MCSEGTVSTYKTENFVAKSTGNVFIIYNSRYFICLFLILMVFWWLQGDRTLLLPLNLFDNRCEIWWQPLRAGNYMFKVNDRNTRTKCEMFQVNNKDTRTTLMANDIILVSLLINLNIFRTSIVNFEQINAGWGKT